MSSVWSLATPGAVAPSAAGVVVVGLSIITARQDKTMGWPYLGPCERKFTSSSCVCVAACTKRILPALGNGAAALQSCPSSFDDPSSPCPARRGPRRPWATRRSKGPFLSQANDAIQNFPIRFDSPRNKAFPRRPPLFSAPTCSVSLHSFHSIPNSPPSLVISSWPATRLPAPATPTAPAPAEAEADATAPRRPTAPPRPPPPRPTARSPPRKARPPPPPRPTTTAPRPPPSPTAAAAAAEATGPRPPHSSAPYGAPPPSSASYGAPPPAYGGAGGYGSSFASLVPSAFPPGTDPNVVACFQAADRDGSGMIDDKELQSALSGYNQSFSLRTVHLLMYLFTNTNVRKIGPKEFTSVFYSLQNWRAIFERFDRDRSGKIDSSELCDALLSLGYSVSPTLLDLLVSKFDKTGGKSKAIEYDNFIECCLTVKGLTEKFKEKDTAFCGSAAFTYEAFMLTVLPFLFA